LTFGKNFPFINPTGAGRNASPTGSPGPADAFYEISSAVIPFSRKNSRVICENYTKPGRASQGKSTENAPSKKVHLRRDAPWPETGKILAFAILIV